MNKTISITEGKTTEVNEVLSNGREVTINSNPSGVALTIDGNEVGQTPYRGNLTFGNHNLRITQGGKSLEKIITIAQTGGAISFMMSFGPQSFTEHFNGVDIEMMAVKGGTFQMGSNDIQDYGAAPVHSVTLSDFYIGKYEVTQAQWKAVMGNNPSLFKGDDLPIEQVSWKDVQKFFGNLNVKTGKRYRLPTEAEWEYAARGGNKSKGYTYAENNMPSNIAWFRDNSSSQTHPVGQKQPNELGLYDMSGNVWEWCSDWYGENYYANSPKTNPTGPSSGSYRVYRGGCWGSGARNCRVPGRSGDTPGYRGSTLGFRLVLIP